jgi:hypothetical protein
MCWFISGVDPKMLQLYFVHDDDALKTPMSMAKKTSFKQGTYIFDKKIHPSNKLNFFQQ